MDRITTSRVPWGRVYSGGTKPLKQNHWKAPMNVVHVSQKIRIGRMTPTSANVVSRVLLYFPLNNTPKKISHYHWPFIFFDHRASESQPRFTTCRLTMNNAPS